MKKLLFIILFSLTFPAFSGTGSGKAIVQYVGPWEGREFLFFFTEDRQSPPNCNSYSGRWVIDIATEKGKALYKVILDAQKQGKNIKVVGTDDCNTWGNSETVKSINF